MKKPTLLWSHDPLWSKACVYMQRALGEPRDSGAFPFWASLALELVARSTLAHVHPALLADTSDRDGRNLVYAFGFTPTIKNFVPKSIPTSEVFSRCEGIVEGFTSELQKFCVGLATMRNEELHSGGLPFETFPNKLWLPRFYQACEALLKFQKKNLDDLLGKEEATAARHMLAAIADEGAKKVMKQIAHHTGTWNAKLKTEKETLRKRAALAAQPSLGHVVKCPACGCKALLTGEEVRQLPPRLEDEFLVIQQIILPNKFVCAGCDLIIEGHSQLHAAELGGQFTNTIKIDPVEYYDVPEHQEEEGYYEEYNNE